MNQRDYGVFLVSVALTACAPQQDWYDESKANKSVNDQRVEQFMLQGMDEVKAKQTMNFETYWRNTEIGHRKDEPVQGQDLGDALTRPSP